MVEVLLILDLRLLMILSFCLYISLHFKICVLCENVEKSKYENREFRFLNAAFDLVERLIV